MIETRLLRQFIAVAEERNLRRAILQLLLALAAALPWAALLDMPLLWFQSRKLDVPL